MIYADHAATTPLSAAAFQAMRPYLEAEFGNPSTLYSFAREPRMAVSAARAELANAIGCSPEEIIITSGGTESDNMALKGSAFCYPNQNKRIITTAIEHPAVLNSCKFLKKLGYDIVYLPVDAYGTVPADLLDSAITEDTILVSVMMANNEIGTVEPIKKLAQVAHSHRVLFHTDAVQAVGHIPVNVNDLGVDMLSASAHKFGGPKGVGFLYIRKGVTIEPLLTGGGQEYGMRSGTENVAGIVGMAAALKEKMQFMKIDMTYLEALRTRLIEKLDFWGIDFITNGAEEHIPGNVSLSFWKMSGEMLLHRLDLMGIEVATGSACNSKETEISHVIQAIKVPSEYAQGTIRVTFGTENNEEEVDKISSAIHKIIRHSTCAI